MTNVLIEGYGHIPSFDLTTKDFLRISKVVPICVQSKLSRHVTHCDILWCDILLIVRGDNPLSAYLARKAIKYGRKVILSLDDDLIEYWSQKKGVVSNISINSLIYIIKNASCIITTSTYLGEKYKKEFGVDYVISNTIVDEEQIKSINNTHNSIKLIYAASRGHKCFFDKLIKPTLNRLYERYGNRVSLTVIGPQIDTTDVFLKIFQYRTMPFCEYRKFMDSNDFDIGFAPLFDTELCRSKYYNKYLEYSINGICGIYSKVLPYTLIVENEINGFLTNNDSEDFYGCICKAIDDKEMRHKCVIQAQNQILRDFSLQKVACKLYDDLFPLLSDKATIIKTTRRYYFMYFRFFRVAIYRIILEHIDKYVRPKI